MEITTVEQNKEKRMIRIENSLREFWDTSKCTNIRIIVVPEEEEKKKGTEKIFEEILVENFPNMGKEIVNQVQEAQRVPYRMNPRRNTPRHILSKLSKTKYKENNIKSSKGAVNTGCCVQFTEQGVGLVYYILGLWNGIGANLKPLFYASPHLTFPVQQP